MATCRIVIAGQAIWTKRWPRARSCWCSIADNIEIAETNRSIAEKKGSPELVEKWAAEIEKIAARVVKLTPPTDPEDGKSAQERLEYAREIVANADYAEYTKAIAIQAPAERIAALETFVKRVPQNSYADQIEAAEFLAYKEMGDYDRTWRQPRKYSATMKIAKTRFYSYWKSISAAKKIPSERSPWQRNSSTG